MLRDGHYDSAQALAGHHGLGELVEAELFVRMRELEEALLKHNPIPVLEWCKENSKTLGDTGKRLAFDLHQQAFIEVRLCSLEKLASVEIFCRATPSAYCYQTLKVVCPQNVCASNYKKKKGS